MNYIQFMCNNGDLQHRRLLENAYYAGVLHKLNLNRTLDENLHTFESMIPYYDAALTELPVFTATASWEWEDMWNYLSDRSYALQYKTVILNAHYADTLEQMNPLDVLRGDWEALVRLSDLPAAPSFDSVRSHAAAE